MHALTVSDAVGQLRAEVLEEVVACVGEDLGDDTVDREVAFLANAGHERARLVRRVLYGGGMFASLGVFS